MIEILRDLSNDAGRIATSSKRATLTWLIGGRDLVVASPSVEVHQENASMRKVVLSLVAISAIALPALAGKFNTKVSVGDKAPPISGLPAVYHGEDTSFSLPDVKDDIVVLVFLANHCPVVQQYEDRIIEFTNDYKDKGVKVVGISVSRMPQDKIPGIKDYVKEHKSNYIYGYDETQEVGRAYGATNTPQFFVLDKERKIRYTGAMDNSSNEARVTKKYLRDAVDALLQGKSPEVDETKAVGCGISYPKKAS
jgi:peroxiredoxin